MVQQIKDVSAELQLVALPHSDVLHHARIPVMEPGPEEGVPPQIARASVVSGPVHRRCGEVTAQQALASGVVNSHRNRSGHVWAVLRRAVVVEIKWCTRLQCDNVVPLPPAENVV